MNANVLFTQHGNEPEPAYTLRRLDSTDPNCRNRYAAALYDPYNPEILFGEVLIVPEWTQPSLSAEAIRQNGGVPPPPEPILPSQFTIHLYNPDQEVVVRHKPKTWNSQPAWEFEMPQQSFKQPSGSALDQIQSGPAMSDVTPKLKFAWRKDGSLSKDFACYLSGKTTTPDGRKKNREPDITISIFKSFKELTFYEPNLYRVEMEDFKGLEVVLMLGAIVIRDVFFTPMKDAFNVFSPPTSSRANVAAVAAPIRRSSTPAAAAAAVQMTGAAIPSQSQQATAPRPQRDTTRPYPNGHTPDLRTQWEIDAKNARIKQQQEAATKERRRRAEEEERETRKLIEAEQRAQRKKQAELDKETERLRKVYGNEDQKSRQQRRHSQPSANPSIVVSSANPAYSARYSHYMPSQQQRHQQHRPQQGRPYMYMQPPGHNRSSVAGFNQSQQSLRPQSSMSFHATTQQPSASAPAIPQLKQKKSFFGFLKPSDVNDPNKLNKKRSSIF